MVARWWPLLVGVVVTPIVVLLGVISGGSGHGDYVVARMLLPWATGLTEVANERWWHGTAVVVTAFAQCPVYGFLIGWRRACAWPLLVTHIAMVVCLFIWVR